MLSNQHVTHPISLIGSAFGSSVKQVVALSAQAQWGRGLAVQPGLIVSLIHLGKLFLLKEFPQSNSTTPLVKFLPKWHRSVKY